MMVKNLFSIFLVLLLTGCATTGMQDPVHPVDVKAAAVKEPVFNGLASEPILNSMDDADRKRLEKLVSTAKAQHSEAWGSYEFTSLNVFVNAYGQPCRTYKIRKTGWLSKESTQTVCRVDDDGWQARNDSVKG